MAPALTLCHSVCFPISQRIHSCFTLVVQDLDETEAAFAIANHAQDRQAITAEEEAYLAQFSAREQTDEAVAASADAASADAASADGGVDTAALVVKLRPVVARCYVDESRVAASDRDVHVSASAPHAVG